MKTTKKEINHFLEENKENIKVFEADSENENEFYSYLSMTTGVNKFAFENNFPYIVQSTRFQPFKFYYSKSIVYFSVKEGEKESIVIIPHAIGAQRKEAIIEFVKLATKSKVKVIIKNIDESELRYWLEKGFEETSKPWSEYSFRDDNSFPQYNVDEQTILKRKINRDYRRLFNRFKDKGYYTEIFSKDNKNKALKMLKMNADFLMNKGVDSDEQIIAGHLFFFDDSIENKVVLQHKSKNKLIGFSYLTIVDDIGFYNALFCLKEKDLMKFLLYEGMEYVFKNFEIDYVGLQGSENNGQDFFKYRYNPSLIIKKTHLTQKKSFL